MEIRQYFYLLQRWLWLIILTAITAGALAFFVSKQQTPIYEASSTLLIINSGNQRSNYANQLANELLATSYAERISNHYVLQASLSSLNLDMPVETLKSKISVQALNRTNLLVLTVEHEDPVIAADLANSIPEAFILRHETQQYDQFIATRDRLSVELEDIEGEIGRLELLHKAELDKEKPDKLFITQANETLLRLKDSQRRLAQNLEDMRIIEASQEDNIVIDEFAQPQSSPVRPNTFTNTLLATVAGAILGIGVIFLIDYLDDTVNGPEDIEEITGLSTLGTLELLKTTTPIEALVVAREPRSPAAEAYRQVRTNIQYVNLDDESKKVLLITSSNPNEGKTTVAANIATALAQSGKRVILVDCDMRLPTLHKLLEVPASKGLSNMIMRGTCDTQYLSSTLIPNLKLLSAGRTPPNPAELLNSERMKITLAWLKTLADYVIIDSPPVLAVTDAVILSQMVNTTLFVVSAQQTRYPAFIEALERIDSVGSTISGVIVNKLNPQMNGIYYQNYYQIDYRPEVDYPLGWRQRLAKLGFTTFFH